MVCLALVEGLAVTCQPAYLPTQVFSTIKQLINDGDLEKKKKEEKKPMVEFC